ncbi:hypothetical protein [Caldibacillus thermoamylovorans]|uniref:hypothetical protein n=1 Tax=Caldibacillus thermoamylovorans TaxID=35841 RepID=UPI0022E2C717|nr:hypothetical protein [Caldibacillus thermoamylovorans]
MVTRIGLLRQKKGFLGSKWCREWISSLKNGVFRLKMPTTRGLVAKNEHFSPQNGDEIRFRRQN